MSWVDYLTIVAAIIILAPFSVYLLVRVGSAAWFKSMQEFITRNKNKGDMNNG
jgi:hypothetical protein